MIILIVGLAFWFVTLFLIISFTQFTFTQGFAQGFLIAWLMVPITYLLSNYVLGHKKIMRWKILKKIALNELNMELNGVFGTISNIINFDRSFSGPVELNNDQISEIIKNNLMDQLKKHFEKKDIEIRDSEREHLLDGKHGEIFKRRSTYLESFLDRYLDYLKPSVTLNVMEISKSLKRLDMHIAIRNKYIKKGWTRFDTDEGDINRLKIFLQTIIDSLYLLKKQGVFIHK